MKKLKKMVKYIFIFCLLFLYSLNNFSQKVDTLHIGNNIQWYYLEGDYKSLDTTFYYTIPLEVYGPLYNEYGDYIGCYCNTRKLYENKDNILNLLKDVKINDIHLNASNIPIDTVRISYSLNYIYEEIKHGYISYKVTGGDYLIKRSLYRKLKRRGGYLTFRFEINNPRKYFNYYVRHKPKYKMIKKLNKKINKKRVCIPDCLE